MAAPLELVAREHAGEVDERSCDARDRQAVGLAHDIIETIECVGLVHAELRGGGAPPQRRYVELAGWHRAQIPSRCRGAVTQDGGIDAATRQHRRPHPRALCQARVANRVHAAVNLMQSSVPDPPRNRPLGHAGGVQLRGRHDAVLTPGERPNRRIATRHEKLFYANDFSCHDANRPAGAAPYPPR